MSFIKLRSIIKWILWGLAITLLSCSDKNQEATFFPHPYYEPEYADGFEIVGFQDSLSRVIRIKTSWQGQDSTAMELFIQRGDEKVPSEFKGQVLQDKAERIVAMSSSYIALLDLIGQVQTVKAVSGLDFINNPYIQAHKDSIADVGYDNNIDFEKLIHSHPDLVLLYGITGSNLIETKLKSLGIPFLYMSEYLEPSPLGRLEWLAVLSEVTGQVGKGEQTFHQIEQRYLRLKEMAAGTTSRPKVMLNTPYGDTWFMASGKSTMATLLEDAGADYIYEQNQTNQSMPIDLEEAFLLASKADFWLNVGQITTLEQLVKSYQKFSSVPSIKEKKVYNCDKRTNEKGGNDFWESGFAHPDLILEDLIHIFHSELNLEESSPAELNYYRRLQ